jgi:hypothetical protein
MIGINLRNLEAAVFFMMVSSICLAKATVVTLSELIRQSDLIVYGAVDHSEQQAPAANASVIFKSMSLLKGILQAHEDVAVPLCNRRPNSEWPDVSKISGNAILFLSKEGGCFNLSHNYRSVVEVRDDDALTAEIKGEPDHQSLQKFLTRIKRLAAKQ